MRKLFGRKKHGSSRDSVVTSRQQHSDEPASSQGSQGETQTNQSSPSQPFQSRGDELANINNYNGAVVMYDAALQSAPYDRCLLLSRSIAYSLSTPPKLDLALKDADDALLLNPRWWEGWLQKGKILFKMGHLKSAEEVLANAAGFAHSTDKATVQKILDEVRASQVPSPETICPQWAENSRAN
jgi:tetratricopeptide (TPR) repeat protein